MYSTLRYTLESNGTTYENDSLQASLFVDLITNLDVQDYIVLEPSEPIEGSIYMQMAALEQDGQMVAEIRFINNQMKNGFQHYSYTTSDRTIMIRYILDYWGHQRLPNLEAWQDVTDEFT
ncbi:hypothetical protein [Paenibacillus kandeliae]|uniref:hypothetical protein n=1 Tax=Paenibacillus kandeliae TaxID=3231269 RepID=UPI00345813D6